MSGFAARMLEAKRAKATARNRGQSIGSKSTVIRTPQVAFADLDELEIGIARIVTGLADIRHGFAADLHHIVLEMNDATIGEIPF
jgi:hypothetical protein